MPVFVRVQGTGGVYIGAQRSHELVHFDLTLRGFLLTVVRDARSVVQARSDTYQKTDEGYENAAKQCLQQLGQPVA